MHLDEAQFLSHLVRGPDALVRTGELAAAAEALRHGDEKPLLRMAAEHDWPGFAEGGADAGPPEFFSVGANFATACAARRRDPDALEPAGPARRAPRGSSTATTATVPRDAFAPFSRAGCFGSLVELGFEVCLSGLARRTPTSS